MSGVSQMPLLVKWSPMVVGLQRVVEVEEPVGDVDEVDHQVGEDAAAEIPEPAPVAEAVLVERLLAGRCRGTPSSRPSSGSMLGGALRTRSVLRFQVRWTLWTLPMPARLDELARLLNVRHAALLRADLHDPLVLVLGVDDRLALGRGRASAASRRRRPCRRRRRRWSSARASDRALPMSTASMSLRSSSSW